MHPGENPRTAAASRVRPQPAKRHVSRVRKSAREPRARGACPRPPAPCHPSRDLRPPEPAPGPGSPTTVHDSPCCLASTRHPGPSLIPGPIFPGDSPLLLLFFSDGTRVQSRPDRVIFFKALGGRKRQRKEVTEAKRKAGVQEEEERGGKVGAVRVSALRKGAAHAPWDKPMRRKLGRGDVGEGADSRQVAWRLRLLGKWTQSFDYRLLSSVLLRSSGPQHLHLILGVISCQDLSPDIRNKAPPSC